MSSIINQNYVGYVDISANGEIEGWIYHASHERPVSVAISVDGKTVETVLCDIRRPDVVESGFSRERCGLRYRLPKQFNDNNAHMVKMIADGGRPLRVRSGEGVEQEEWMVILSPEELIAQVDTWLGQDVHCWAITVDTRDDRREVAQCVVVRQSGHDIAKLYPTIDRPDVAETYDCASLCGFLLPYSQIQTLSDRSPIHFFCTSWRPRNQWKSVRFVYDA